MAANRIDIALYDAKNGLDPKIDKAHQIQSLIDDIPSTKGQIYLAFVQDNPVGFYNLWTNKLHPQTLYFNVTILPKYQHSGVGTALFKHFYTNCQHDYLQTSIWNNNAAGEAFLKHLGFRLYRKTYEPSLKLSKVNTKVSTLSKYKIKPLVEIINTPKYLKLIKLSKESYRLSHLDNPLTNVSLAEWKDLFETDLDSEGSFALEDNRNIIAFANLHKVSKSVAEFGWCGVDSNYETYISAIMLTLSLKQIEYAKKRGFKIIKAEIDSTDKCAFSMYEQLPFTQQNLVWLSYQKKLS